MITIDTALLNKKIKESGLKKNAIAGKLKLTCAGLNKKLVGNSEFKASEIQSIAKTLNLSTNEIFAIFFTELVDNTSTSDQKGT